MKAFCTVDIVESSNGLEVLRRPMSRYEPGISPTQRWLTMLPIHCGSMKWSRRQDGT